MQKNHFEVILENIESKIEAVLEIVADHPTRAEFNAALERIDDSSRRIDAHQLILEFHEKAINNNQNTLERYNQALKSLQQKAA